MDWHDPDYRAWVCEQIGVEYKGLPLTHQQKQRFLSLSQKSKMEYTPPNKRNIIMTQPIRPTNENSALTENALIGQYDREIQAIEEKKNKFSQMIKDLAAEGKALTKKRAAVAKALGLTGAILCFLVSGCVETDPTNHAHEVREVCERSCEEAGGTLVLIRIREGHAYGYDCECRYGGE